MCYPKTEEEQDLSSTRWGRPNCGREKAIEGAFNSYFQELFTSNNPTQETVAKCIEHVPSKVTNEMNENLSRPYSSEEVLAALKQMSN